MWPSGCPVTRLWQCLESGQLPIDVLPDPLKQAIWAALLEPGTSIALCHAPKATEKG